MNRRSRFILLLLAMALLLPVYGSWINFHFAALQANHKHIYLGQVKLNHHRTADTKDIIMLPNQDAASEMMLSIYLPDQQMAVNNDETDDLFIALTAEYHTPEAAYLPPPDHPPRITANPTIS